MAVRRMAIGIASLFAMGAALPNTTPPAIAGIHAIALHGGINRVPGFMTDGSAATIVQAWSDNGNAHGHYSWMVIGGGRGGSGLVGFEASKDDPATGDIIGASPFDGERVTGDVRFATARIAGKRVSLVVKGTLDWPPSGVTADHATATIRWYRLVHHGGDWIGPPDLFHIIGTAHSNKRYCNVDLALRDVAGIPLPSDFAGANRIDGCFDGD